MKKSIAFVIAIVMLVSQSLILATNNNYIINDRIIGNASIDNPGTIVLRTTVSNNYYDWTSYVSSSQELISPVYSAIVSINGVHHLIFASLNRLDSGGNYIRCKMGRLVTDINSSNVNYNADMINSTFGNNKYGDYYYLSSSTFQTGTNLEYYYTVYDSNESALNDIVNGFISPVESYSLNYSLPAGNVIFVELPQNVENSFIATTSSAIDHSNPWTSSNQTYGFFDSIPSAISAPLSGTQNFTWYGTGSNSVFGTFKSWRSSHDIQSGKYLAIVNPAYPNDSPENQALNGSIGIYVDKAISFKVFQLNAGWTNGTIDNSSTGTIYDGSYDPDNQTWSTVDQTTGLPSNPISGGYNAGFSTDGMTIADWLENIAHQISGFFKGAIGAVTTLANAISQFAGTLQALYIWLPPAVQAILTSALILAITIGVIKVFV